jgi:hypothetical protein
MTTTQLSRPLPVLYPETTVTRVVATRHSPGQPDLSADDEYWHAREQEG